MTLELNWAKTRPLKHQRHGQVVHDGRPAQRAHRGAREDRARQQRVQRPPQPAESAHTHGDQGGPLARHGVHQQVPKP